MVILALILMIIVNLLMQSTILPQLNILGIIPNINLVTIIIVAFLRGKYYGGFFGLATGLLQDVLFSRTIGVNGLIYFLIGYVAGDAQSDLSTENPVVTVVMTALSTIVYNFMYFIFMYFLANDIQLTVAFKKIFSLEILLNSILAFLLFQLYSKVFVVPSLRFGKKLR